MMEKLYSAPNHKSCLNSLNPNHLNMTTQPKLLGSWSPHRQLLFVTISLKMASHRTIQTTKALSSKSKLILRGHDDRSTLTMLCYTRLVVNRSLLHPRKTTKTIQIVIPRKVIPVLKRGWKMVSTDPKSCLERDNASLTLRIALSSSLFQKMDQSRV